MPPLVRWAALAVAAAALAACSGDGTTPGSTSTPTTSTPSAPAPTPTGAATSPGDGSPGDAATPSAVPTVAELAGLLATTADLGAGWSLWEGFAAWPGGIPGPIPEDQRALIPVLPMCPAAGEEATALAGGLRWQAFTQLHRATPDPFANMVVVQQVLLAEEPAQVAAAFATLRDGLARCLTDSAGDWEIGLRQEVPVPAVGDERWAELHSGVDPGGARRDTRWFLIREGALLMAIQLDDILITPDAEPALTREEVDAVVAGLAGRLP